MNSPCSNLFPPSPLTPSNQELHANVSAAPGVLSRRDEPELELEKFISIPPLSPLTPLPSPRNCEMNLSKAFPKSTLTTLGQMSPPTLTDLHTMTGTPASPGHKPSADNLASNALLKTAIERQIEETLRGQLPSSGSCTTSSTSPVTSSSGSCTTSSTSPVTSSSRSCTTSSTSPVTSSSGQMAPSCSNTSKAALTAKCATVSSASVHTISSAAPQYNFSDIGTTTSTVSPSSTHVPMPTLPPCRVCGGNSSGFHYGVTTCEACKGFFRRSLIGKKEYTCLSGSDDCNVISAKRRFCAKCRFRKCLDVGMAREAIKTGRYTHQKRTQVINEVKRIHAQSRNITLVNLVDSGTRSNVKQNEVVWSCEDTHDVITEPDVHACNVSSPSDVTLRLSEEMQNSLRSMLELAKLCDAYKEEHIKNIPKIQAEYMEKQRLKEELFGPMSSIPYEEAREIYVSTGYDLGGRRQMFLDHSGMVEESVKRLITFAKGIPGFKTLPMDDQIGLIKNSRFEVAVIGFHRAVSIPHGLITLPNGCTLQKGETLFSADKEFTDGVFRIAERLQQMKLFRDEFVIFKALPLVFTDRCELERPDKVEMIQKELLTILEYLFKKNHPEVKHLFAKALILLTDMRILTDKFMKLCKKFVVDWSLQLPPLVYELIF